MIEADSYCFIALLYSAFICLSSMSMFWWLEVKPGWEWLADMLVLLWIGVSMSGVAWTKVWMNKPTFNTGIFPSLSDNNIKLQHSVHPPNNSNMETMLRLIFNMIERTKLSTWKQFFS